jgi:hypothetical protein
VVFCQIALLTHLALQWFSRNGTQFVEVDQPGMGHREIIYKNLISQVNTTMQATEFSQSVWEIWIDKKKGVRFTT